MVKNLPVMQVQSLAQKDPLEEEVVLFLPGKSHGQRNLAGYSLSVCERVGRDLATK